MLLSRMQHLKLEGALEGLMGNQPPLPAFRMFADEPSVLYVRQSIAPTPRKYNGQTEDGSLRWNGAEDAKTGNLLIRFRFASRKMILWKGALLVRLGDLTRRVWLKEVGENQWRGEIIFTRQERSDLPDDADFSVAVAE
ncbi:MAG TPA: hypothetical protein VFR55_08910 [Dehalococcoidia bacterium]|nr:hypothetical protein [Dehalococcoidia bacterium]